MDFLKLAQSTHTEQEEDEKASQTRLLGCANTLPRMDFSIVGPAVHVRQRDFVVKPAPAGFRGAARFELTQ